MNLDDFLGPENILPDLKAINRWEAIDELLNNLVLTGKIMEEDRNAIAVAVKKREHDMSTGIGLGIGLPHAETDLIHEVVAAVGSSKQGIDFDALDKQPVNLVLLFLVPKGQLQKHVHTLTWPSYFIIRNSAKVWGFDEQTSQSQFEPRWHLNKVAVDVRRLQVSPLSSRDMTINFRFFTN